MNKDKTLNKTKLDELIERIRHYWHEGEVSEATEKLVSMRKFYEANFPRDLDLRGFLNSIISGFGLKPEATNEDIYKALEVLGYEVVE